MSLSKSSAAFLVLFSVSGCTTDTSDFNIIDVAAGVAAIGITVVAGGNAADYALAGDIYADYLTQRAESVDPGSTSDYDTSDYSSDFTPDKKPVSLNTAASYTATPRASISGVNVTDFDVTQPDRKRMQAAL